MGLFSRKKEEVEEVDELELETPKRKIRDLKPENKRARKEPIKPWGAKERIVVLAVLLVTVLTSGVLALTARNFKLPQLPRLKTSDISILNPFREQVVVVGNKGSKISQEKIENTKKLFKEATNDYSGLYAFYIYDINGDYYYGYNHQEIMQAASLIKLPVMYLAMKNGEDKTLIEAMGKRSDNGAFNKMVATLGKENINRAILDLGMSHTSLSENETTPEEIGIFFKKLYLNEILNIEDSLLFQSYMTDTIFENWLRSGIPTDIKVVHKYGRELHSVSDAGIIISDKPFVMVIMTDGVIEKEADELFPKLTKLLYDNHIAE
ncbi:MAG: serine hydrolase [Microgenomates group bacterium]